MTGGVARVAPSPTPESHRRQPRAPRASRHYIHRVPDLIATYGWPLLVAMAVAALIIGFSKTSFGGIAAISVAVFALGMPAKESTATVLLLLLVGDLVAVSRYRTVSWSLLLRLVPSVLPGLVVGAAFMNVVDDVTMRRTIGGLLLVMVLLQLWQRRPRQSAAAQSPAAPESGEGPAPIAAPQWGRAVATGAAAGFATMTANAAGPVMALYFLAARVDKARFIGTNAWFFFLINLSKTPFTTGLGLYSPVNLFLVATLIPAVLLGTVAGVWVIGKVTQRQFEIVTIAASAIASAVLLVR